MGLVCMLSCWLKHHLVWLLERINTVRVGVVYACYDHISLIQKLGRLFFQDGLSPVNLLWLHIQIASCGCLLRIQSLGGKASVSASSSTVGHLVHGVLAFLHLLALLLRGSSGSGLVQVVTRWIWTVTRHQNIGLAWTARWLRCIVVFPHVVLLNVHLLAMHLLSLLLHSVGTVARQVTILRNRCKLLLYLLILFLIRRVDCVIHNNLLLLGLSLNSGFRFKHRRGSFVFGANNCLGFVEVYIVN
jgi:hypothetical protein